MAKKLLMGNEAMAHAALEAGVTVVAGYPGTPSSEIVETVARLHESGAAKGVHVEWSTNEKVALELLFGASLAGARCLFTCKQMGLNVASDALMSLNYVSVRGGLVLVVADDPGPISSQTEQDTRRFAAFAKVPVLDPATPEQAFDMIKVAFELSERYHTPVIVRPTTRVDHASAFFEVEDETCAQAVPEAGFERDVSKWVIFPRRAFQGHGEINDRLPEIAHTFAVEDAYRAFNPIEGAEDAIYGIVASGISASYAREALRMVEERAAKAGLKVPPYRLMQVGTPYPFPEETAAEFVQGLGDILVIEELDFVLEDAFARFAGRTHASFAIHGKLTGEARDRGENDVDDVASRLEKFLGLSGRLRRYRRELADKGEYVAPPEYMAELPARPPVLCAGCPHRGSFYAIKKALGRTPAVMCGDIGCYTLGNALPLDAVDTCLCMGGGITMAQGFSIADPGKKAIAYVGDSTFFASGMPGLANAAYNGHDITVMVLDNSTTAMTGTQPHPGTGQTLMGPKNDPLSILRVLNANGFTRVYHVNPLDKDESIVAAKAAIAFEGPSAVIFEAPCIQLSKPDEPVVVDTEVCTGCKKCITEIGCPAISFDAQAEGPRSGDRGQAVIDDTLCNGCDLCTQVCPFHAIEAPLISRIQFEPHSSEATIALDPVDAGDADEPDAVDAGKAPEATGSFVVVPARDAAGEKAAEKAEKPAEGAEEAEKANGASGVAALTGRALSLLRRKKDEEKKAAVEQPVEPQTGFKPLVVRDNLAENETFADELYQVGSEVSSRVAAALDRISKARKARGANGETATAGEDAAALEAAFEIVNAVEAGDIVVSDSTGSFDIISVAEDADETEHAVEAGEGAVEGAESAGAEAVEASLPEIGVSADEGAADAADDVAAIGGTDDDAEAEESDDADGVQAPAEDEPVSTSFNSDLTVRLEPIKEGDIDA